MIRRHNDQIGTDLPRLPDGHGRLYSAALCLGRFRQHNAVARFRIAADGDGLSAQFRMI